MATITEEELEDYLFKYDSSDGDSPMGTYGKVYRQFEIKGYGIIDLLYVDISPGCNFPVIKVVIVELKKDKIDFNALGQICRYKVALERFFDELREKKDCKYFEELEIHGVLVGNKYANGDICYSIDTIDWLECYHYEIDLSCGAEFRESSGWYNEGENFKKLYSKIKDFKEEYLKFYKEELRYGKRRKFK
jgi:hypothetical protein